LSDHHGAERVTTVVVGAGHAGLAASHHLTQRSIDHVVLERGEVANSWRHERWDSMRLLTPSWQTGLPGQPYDGPDPDGYLSSREVAELVSTYAVTSAAPVRTGVEVTSVRTGDDG
jgi:putative flavoprotein involved in K+ transport